MSINIIPETVLKIINVKGKELFRFSENTILKLIPADVWKKK